MKLTAQILGLTDRHKDKLLDWMTEWAQLVQLHVTLDGDLGNTEFEYNGEVGQTADSYALAKIAITDYLAVDILQMSDHSS